LSGSPASPVITKCTIRGNDSFGVYCFNTGSPTISRCIIIDNGSVGLLINGPEMTISNCVVARNAVGGISLFGAPDASVINCTIVSNSTYGIRRASKEIKNCIIWDNGDDLRESTAKVTYSCIEDGDSGWGTFSADPAFVNSDSNDFHLSGWSICIDRGDPYSDYSNEPNGGGGRINMGVYGNTDEATTTTDDDGDGIADEWEQHYWPSDDPNQHDPNDDPDGDGFSNQVEYLFGYDPNVITTAFMELIAFLSDSQIDPINNETVTISYFLNMGANVDVSFTNSDDSNKTVRTISQTGPAGPLNEAVWNGTDANGLVVERYFYDVSINANDGDGNSTNWMSLVGPQSYVEPRSYSVDTTDFNPYKNIPVEITSNIPDWVTHKIDIVKDGHTYSYFVGNDDDRICHLIDDRLVGPGENTFYWYGRWGDDINDPNAGTVCTEAFDVWFKTPLGKVKKGAVLVYYDEPLSNLRCNPYRVVPIYDEITTITYELACDVDITIDIYDPDGNYFGTIFNNVTQTKGTQEIVWYGKDGDPNDPNGRYISSEGVYSIEVKTADPSYTLEGSITVYR
jgi:hypothetical protein